ncbi:MAG: sel1 repeat family protein [Nitrospira sp. CG24E]|nr:MAG: sel1 repeat family protein [Nitrospira sp. CG24E]
MQLRFLIPLVLSVVSLTLPAWADFQAGMNAKNRGDFEKALREWQPLAEQGDARAQFYLGLLHQNGDGIPQSNEKAREWYEKSAAQGEANAQFYLGLLSAFGQGGPIDLVQAYMWYSLAAENGHPRGALNRSDLARQMKPAQITEAQKRAKEWKTRTPGL